MRLDAYSHGLRNIFPAVEQLVSLHCRSFVARGSASHRFGADCIEQGNAELVTAPSVSPGPGFASTAREAILKLFAVAHRVQGGVPPLVVPFQFPGGASRHHSEVPHLEQSPAPAEMLPAVTNEPLLAGTRTTSALVAHTEGTLQLATEHRPSPARIPSNISGSQVGTQGSSAYWPKRGLSPYMLECNRYLLAATELKDSAPTNDEVHKARSDFRQLWSHVARRDLFSDAYNELHNQAQRMSDNTQRRRRLQGHTDHQG